MDKPTITDLEGQLLDAGLATARKMGLIAEVLERHPLVGRGRADALIKLGRPGQMANYMVEVKKTLQQATFDTTLDQLTRLGAQALLVTTHVTPNMADRLKAEGHAFLDAAGNAYLEQEGLYIWVKGEKPTTIEDVPEAGRAFQRTTLQVLFVLLCNPKVVNRPIRELAAMAGVAHGTVGWALADLKRLGFIDELKGKRGTRKMFNRDALLSQWTDAYVRTLWPRNLIGRYYIEKPEHWRDWPLAEHNAMWGGEPGGALLTDYLRPAALTLYAQKLPGALAARFGFAKEPTPGRTTIVEIRRRFWTFQVEQRDAAIVDLPKQLNVVPPLLVYADLMATGDGRCIETAKLVYERYVARLFTEA